MEGEGKFFFENGNVYEGQFLNNQFHGQGTITFPGKGKYEAVWVYGKATQVRARRHRRHRKLFRWAIPPAYISLVGSRHHQLAHRGSL